MANLLLVAHAPSPNTLSLQQAVQRGIRHPDIDNIRLRVCSPFRAQPEDLLWADGVILGTTENFGYMSGALKDFFDRCYYPCLERTEGLPAALYVRAGNDGSGACSSVERIVAGLRWRWVQPPLVLAGTFQDSFEVSCEELGMLMAAGLEAGVL